MITQDEYLTRQKRLLAHCLPNSIVIIAGASEIVRSRDTHFPFRQDSDFFYLTGFNEPDAWLVMSNRLGTGTDAFRAMAVRPSDPEAEIWHGRRLGVERAEERFSLDMCFDSEAIVDSLYDLVDGHDNLYFSLHHNAQHDDAVLSIVSALKQARMAAAPAHIIDWQPLIHEMRLFKSCTEIAVMKQSAHISAHAHIRAMQKAHKLDFEYQLAAEIQHDFARKGASGPAYDTIVGSGINACILHYTENADALRDGDLVLIDAGSEYEGYAADITRTFPINGTFSTPQKQIYQLVLDAQLAALALLGPGVTIAETNIAAVRVLIEGLCELGLLDGNVDTLIKDQAYRRFYMHGLGHWLGLDVHDVGAYKLDGEDRPLQPGMVMTVEPGLYIPDEDDIPEDFRGIGVRIEDNIVITAQGHEVLTAEVPKTVQDIEALMQKSAEGTGAISEDGLERA